MELNGIRKSGIIIQGFDVLDIVSVISKSTKKYQATLLSQIEEVLQTNTSEEYIQIRKLILDSSNNFSRLIVKSLFGDIEM